MGKRKGKYSVGDVFSFRLKQSDKDIVEWINEQELAVDSIFNLIRTSMIEQKNARTTEEIIGYLQRIEQRLSEGIVRTTTQTNEAAEASPTLDQPIIEEVMISESDLDVAMSMFEID